MGTAIIKLKIMPENPETDLNEIELNARKIIEPVSVMPMRIEKEPIAFGIIALILTFAVDESLQISEVEDKLKAIPYVSSSEIIDFRRAFG
jgi:translation elongation factor aEF-1 beta